MEVNLISELTAEFDLISSIKFRPVARITFISIAFKGLKENNLGLCGTFFWRSLEGITPGEKEMLPHKLGGIFFAYRHNSGL